MRFLLFASPLLFLLANACSTYGFAEGSASYTTSPATADHSGALPLQTLVCLPAAPTQYRRSIGVSLGGCSLVGAYEARGGRGVTPGGMASLNADGQCALPTGAGLLPIRVANATFEKNLDAVDLTVGGTAADGRYVTYHFNGVMSEGDATTACDALLNPRTL